MPSRKSALKHIRSDEKKHQRNMRMKTALKTAVRKYNLLIKKGESENAKKILPSLSSALDKAAKRGIIHQKNADRKKARLAKKVASS